MIEFSNASRTITRFKTRFKVYLPLIKSRQTGLLLFTGFTGYVSARCPVLPWGTFIGLMGSLFLTIAGSTVLNMVFDRDIDAGMKRTEDRPLPAGKISVNEALYLGLALSFGGLVWSFLLSLLYGVVVFAGIFIDVVIYTILLKRKTAWSIVWGGISGGMPILAGRVLGLGHLDIIGGFLSLAVLLWIPTHIVTFSMKYDDDYRRAGIPTFPSTYGYRNSRLIIAFSSLGASIAICLGLIALGLSWGYLRLLAILTVGMLGLAIVSVFRPSDRVNLGLFKYASLYMLSSMLMVTLGVQA
jgi:protoheme IX farnesyltransferase